MDQQMLGWPKYITNSLLIIKGHRAGQFSKHQFLWRLTLTEKEVFCFVITLQEHSVALDILYGVEDIPIWDMLFAYFI